jgi:serine/threonine protein kinase/HD-like signal output (HDOD) protein
MSVANTMEELVPNAQLGHYTIISHLAEGGMGHVYRAFEPSLQREVAIKVLKEELANNPQYRKFFDSEATNIAALRHPSIVPIYFVGNQGDIYYFVMPFIEGSTLDDWIEGEVRMNSEQGLWVLNSAVDALDWAYRHTIVHLDIKPSNFLVDSNGTILLTDFGLAKSLNESLGEEEQECFGTPAYISPEQILRKPADQRSDIYSLGATLYHLLTMNFLYDGDSVEDIILKHLEEPFPYEKAQACGLSPGWINLIDRMTQKNPDDRFQTYEELRDAVLHMNSLKPVRKLAQDATRSGPIPVPIRGGGRKEFLYGILSSKLESWAVNGIDKSLVRARADVLGQIASKHVLMEDLVPSLKELAMPMEGEVQDLAAALEMLPEVEKLIISLANMPFCSEEPIDQRKKAIRAVGLHLSRNLVLSGILIREWRDKYRGEFNWFPLWQHSIATGLTATFLLEFLASAGKEKKKSFFGGVAFKKIFQQTGKEQAYFAGFIHDIGKLILSEIAAYPHFVALRRSIEEMKPLLEEEKKVLGVDHQEAGTLWLGRMGFDPLVREVAAKHDAEASKINLTTAAVVLANQMVKRHGLSYSGDAVVEISNFGETPAWQVLKKEMKCGDELLEVIHDEFVPVIGQMPLLEPPYGR